MTNRFRTSLPRISLVYFVALYFNTLLSGSAFNAGQEHARIALGTAGQSSRQISAEVQTFLDRVSELPIEYKADLTFSFVSQAPELIPAAERTKLVKSIFQEAPKAHYPTPLLFGAERNNSVAHQETLNLAWLHLDALDLQIHALTLLRLSAPRSFTLFNRITFAPSRSTCDDAFIPDVSVYYRQMALILKSIPGDILPNGTRRETYLSGALENASPSQLLAFLQNYSSLDLQSTSGDVVRRKLEATLASVNPSDREMSAVEGPDGEMTDLIKNLLKTPEYAGVKAAPLLAAYRTFLIAGLHGKACTDTSLDRHEVASQFNSLAPDLIGDDSKAVQSLTTKDLSPDGYAVTPSFDRIGDYKSRVDQLNRLFKVMIANQTAHNAFSPTERYIQPEPSDVNAVLRFANSLEETDNGNDLSRYENCQSVYDLLITFLPPGPSFRDVIDAEASFLNLNPIEQSNPPAWLREFKSLIFISRKPNQEAIEEMRKKTASGVTQIMTPSRDGDFIMTTLKRYDADPIISTYVMYEQIVKPPYVTFEKSSQIW